jgi:hypothetical protein
LGFGLRLIFTARPESATLADHVLGRDLAAARPQEMVAMTTTPAMVSMMMPTTPSVATSAASAPTAAVGRQGHQPAHADAARVAPAHLRAAAASRTDDRARRDLRRREREAEVGGREDRRRGRRLGREARAASRR